jgi:hypothetical protein
MNGNVAFCMVACVSLLSMASGDPAQAAKAPSEKQLVASAEKAAPTALAKHASIATIGADGKMNMLRQGTNGFTCMPDDPTSPGLDPMCVDGNAMAWLEALVAHQPPPDGRPGIVYMLAGGSDASNTDPYASGPKADNHWIATGAHVMMVGAKGALQGYPRSADPNTGEPYVMWPDTPYEHLMLPVR